MLVCLCAYLPLEGPNSIAKNGRGPGRISPPLDPPLPVICVCLHVFCLPVCPILSVCLSINRCSSLFHSVCQSLCLPVCLAPSVCKFVCHPSLCSMRVFLFLSDSLCPFCSPSLPLLSCYHTFLINLLAPMSRFLVGTLVKCSEFRNK